MKRLWKNLKLLLNPRSDFSDLPSTLSPQDNQQNVRSATRRRAVLLSIFTNIPLLLGATIVLILFLTVLFGPSIAPQNPYLSGRPIEPYYDPDLREFRAPPLPPSPEYPLGTDRWGIDILSLLLHGARNTLVACAFITMARVFLGTLLGGLAGWNEGKPIDQLIMSSIGVITALPILISSMITIYALDIRRGLPVFIIALTFVGWTEIAQFIRTEFQILKKMPYIDAANSAGQASLSTAVRHILPNILPHLVIITFMEMGAVMMLLGELGYIGVYIGGGSRIAIEVALDVRQVFQLVDVPEWGAMMAEGYRFLRSRPFVIFPPAMAFAVAVVGFNTLGEGIRHHIQVHGLNTGLLLRKRMLLIAVGLVMATVYIIQQTGPAPWISKSALSFSAQRAYNETQILTGFSGRGQGQDGAEATVTYLVDRFQQAGLEPGGKHNSYLYSVNARVVRPITQPELTLMTSDGNVHDQFIHQLDFGFIIDDHGGTGEAKGQITFVGFLADGEASFEDFQGLDLKGRIVLLLEGNAPPSFPTEALIRGAEGIIWVSPDASASFQSQLLAIGDTQNALRNPTLPIFRVSNEVAQLILGVDDLGFPDLFDLEAADRITEDWLRRDLTMVASMQLELSEPDDIELHHVLGYRPGSDIDHAGELILLLANYDGLGSDPDGTLYPGANDNASGLASLIEIAQLWEEQSLNPLQPVLFVAWGTGTQEFEGLAEFLQDPINFRHLIAANPNVRLSPAVMLSIEAVGSGEDSVQILENRADEYLDVLIEAASERKVSIVLPKPGSQARPFGAGLRIPWIHLRWSQTDTDPRLDGFSQLELDKFQEFGEVFALFLAKLLRQTNF